MPKWHITIIIMCFTFVDSFMFKDCITKAKQMQNNTKKNKAKQGKTKNTPKWFINCFVFGQSRRCIYL